MQGYGAGGASVRGETCRLAVIEVVEIVVGKMESGKKVHRLMRQLLPGVPLSGIHKMIRTGRVKRNGKRVKAEDVVVEGDRLALYMAEADYLEVRKAERKFGGVPDHLHVVFEDEELLVVNKPVGLLTHGAAGEHKDTLVNRVLAYLHRSGQLDQRQFVPAPINRLDRNTSGLILFGKTGDATRRLASEFSSHAIRKWYIGLVDGLVDVRGEIRAPLDRDPTSNRTVVSEHGGRPAVTRYVRKATNGKTSVVHIELVSGRTHQIRAHFAYIGHPLWGDFKYGSRPRSRGQEPIHQWLHAAWLELSDGRRFHAPLPEAFVAKLLDVGYRPDQIKDVSAF
ncbi:MAG: RluA family pseudouridine synthase [Alicyclobacillus sp.]|nr:RluA family pseudouridine synthase [Alicyclobacillus sp.]